jgi:hypothetical protein
LSQESARAKEQTEAGTTEGVGDEGVRQESLGVIEEEDVVVI